MNTAFAGECLGYSTESETQQCLLQALGDADRTLNECFAELLNTSNADTVATLKAEQRAWIQKRNRLCLIDKTLAARSDWLERLSSMLDSSHRLTELQTQSGTPMPIRRE